MAASSSGMISLSIHDCGVVWDDRKRKVQCMPNATRWLALDVAPCHGAPLHVRELFRKQIVDKGKILAQELDHHEQVTIHETASTVNPYTRGVLTARDAGGSEPAVSKEVVEFFLQWGMLLSVQPADSPSFQRMLGETTSDEPEGGMLEDQPRNVQEKVD